jgi:hypothetical protein
MAKKAAVEAAPTTTSYDDLFLDVMVAVRLRSLAGEGKCRDERGEQG